MNSTERYDGLYETILKHEHYFYYYKSSIRFMAVSTNILVLLTLYVILKSKSTMTDSYKNALLTSVLGTTLCINWLAFFSPYVCFPFDIILDIGPIRLGAMATAYKTIFMMSIAMPVVLSLIYTAWYHYLVLCNEIDSKFGKVSIRFGVVTFILYAGISPILFILAAQSDQTVLISNISAGNSELEHLLVEYSAYVMSFHEVSIYGFILRAIVGFDIVFINIVAYIVVMKIIVNLYKLRNTVTARTFKNQISVFILLAYHGVVYVIFYGIPITAAYMIVYSQLDVRKVPVFIILAITMIIPTSIFCFTYLLVFQAFRDKFMEVTKLRKLFPRQEERTRAMVISTSAPVDYT